MQSRIRQVVFMAILTPLLILFIFSLLLSNKERLSEFFPNILVISYLTSCIIGFSMQFSSYNERGVFSRVLISPLKIGYFIISMVISQLILVIIESCVIIVSSMLMYKLKLDINFTKITSFNNICLILGYIFSLLLIGVFISLISKNTQVTSSISNFLNLILLMISNIFFPISLFPSWMEKINHVNIVYFLQQTMQATFNVGNVSYSLPSSVTIVLAYIFVFGIIDIFLFKKCIVSL